MQKEEELVCCLCKTPFTAASQPRMMPHCAHSICTYCLKQLLSSQVPTFECQICRQQEVLQGVELENFPKNISLNKVLKEKTCLLNPIKEDSPDTEESTGPSGIESSFCDLHKKEMEIVCLTDYVKICPHCALFSTHREHHLKTLKEVVELMQQKEAEFQSFRSRKAILECRSNSADFKEGIVKKIGEHKNRLVADIKKKFGQLHENLKLAEKKAYEDVAKKFKTVSQKISELVKQENDHQKEYRLWERKCQQLFEKANKCSKIEDKSYYYFNGPLDLSKDGSLLLANIEAKINRNLAAIDSLISRIKVVDSPPIANSLFNYINVLIEDQEQLELLGVVGQETISPKVPKNEESLGLVDFGSDKFLKEPGSPLSPVKRYSSKETPKEMSKSRTSERSIRRVSSAQLEGEPQNVEEIISDFCEKANQETLDLSCQSLCDLEIHELLKFVKTVKKVKGLKLVKNRLTTDGLLKVLEQVPSVTNLNLSFNQLTDDCINLLLSSRDRVPQLRIVNLSNNKINERRVKTAIEELKKQGLIVTI